MALTGSTEAHLAVTTGSHVIRQPWPVPPPRSRPLTAPGPRRHDCDPDRDTGSCDNLRWWPRYPDPNPGRRDPNPGTPDPKLTLVTPNYPSATEADCSHRGRLVGLAQPAGVVVSRSGSVPGDVTFTFAPAAGYAFPPGTETEVTVTVDAKLSGEDCILGEETTSPKPHTTKPKPKPRDRAPIVLGTQAAVPTAVDAGLAGLPSASVSPISSPRLAQALVAGGLLLLIAGGSMGLGRRTRGAHES